MSVPKDEDLEGMDDSSVAASRAGKGGDEGTYVGETEPDDAIDAGETGAEARSKQRDR
ncbi:hypothetical protein [Mycobacterium sp.]|uniref:hypothetical protein n=1 Tax=Mycobacterium sp. TaxID=1785 RepID=UPI002D5C8BDE|nr:hypothetical protein [Mycobacterium sp.]HZA08869.1 hypothetical protein [Mycobacterium sp.]